MLPPNGSARVTPATTVTVSINPWAEGCRTGMAVALVIGSTGALGMSVVVLVNEQLRATAPSQA